MARRRLFLSPERIVSGIRDFSTAWLLWSRRREADPQSWIDGPACRWELRTVALWGEELWLRAVSIPGEEGIVVDYLPRLRWPAIVVVAACLTIGIGAIWQVLRSVSDVMGDAVSPAASPGDRDRPELLVTWFLLAFLSLTLLHGLHAISKRIEARFWKALGFDAKRDRVRSGSLVAEGHPMLGEIRRSAFALGFVAASCAILKLPSILFQALCLLTALQIPRLFFSGRSGLLRRSELGWSLGFRDGQFAVVLIALHAMFVWVAASLGSNAEQRYATARDQRAQHQQLRPPIALPAAPWGIAPDITDILPLASKDHAAFGLPAAPKAASFGRVVLALDDGASRLAGGSGGVLRQFLVGIGFLLGALPLGLLVLFLHSCFATAKSWSDRFGGALRAGEYLLAIEEDREPAPQRSRLFASWLITVWAAGLVLQGLILLLAGEILLHAFFASDLPGLDRLWIPYSLWFESAGEDAAIGSAVAALTLLPMLAFPRVAAVIWWLRAAAVARAAGSSSRTIRAEVYGYQIQLVSGPAWVRIPQLAWVHGPVVVLPEKVLLRLTAGPPQAGAPGPLLALAAHECLHFNRYARRTFLTWLGASSIGIPGFFRLLEDPIGEEFRADEAALAVAGKQSLQAAFKALSRRGLRAASRWGRLGDELRWVREIVQFHFAQGALGYAHPTPEARLLAIEAWTTKTEQAPSPNLRPPSGRAVTLAKIAGLALGLAASAASVAGWYLAFLIL